MPWIPWIEIEDEHTSNEEARQLYETTRNAATQKLSDLVRITSLTPQTSALIHQLSLAVYRNATGLSAREKELAALVTSALNGCVH